jgi:alpha-beta hydrolase superfamily lysophospholipase
VNKKKMTVKGPAMRIDIHIEVPLETQVQPRLGLAATLYLPQQAPELIVTCLSGGDMNRKYFDLDNESVESAGRSSFSLAQHLVSSGLGVLTIDHPGVGGGDTVDDPYLLTSEIVARAECAAIEQVMMKLRNGSLGLQPLPEVRSCGLGHSMGAMLTVVAQAQSKPHDALILMGFSTRGMPENITQEMVAASCDPQAARTRLAGWARDFFSGRASARPEAVKALFKNDTADPFAMQALKRVRVVPALPLCAVQAMLPNNVGPEAAAIDVPVLIVLGEHDIAGPPHDVPRAFTSSKDITLHIAPGAGHSLLPFSSRKGVFDAITNWATNISERPRFGRSISF